MGNKPPSPELSKAIIEVQKLDCTELKQRFSDLLHKQSEIGKKLAAGETIIHEPLTVNEVAVQMVFNAKHLLPKGKSKTGCIHD